MESLTASLSDIQQRIAAVQTQVAETADQVRRAARAEASERLNNAVRRLRQSDSRDTWFRTLVDVTSEFAARTAVFSVSAHMIRHEGEPSAEAAITSAAAFANAVESKDVVVAAATPRELSPEFFEFLGINPGTKVWLFPLLTGDNVSGVLYAQPGESPLDVSAIELLCSFPGAWTDRAEEVNPEPAPADLIRISGIETRPKAPAAERPAWSDLSPADQQIHLRAQRFARNTVADLILHKAEKVRRGRASNALYITLREEIDAARDTFRRQFVHQCPSMVDYLHVELLRTLAKDDSRALGTGYPGPVR